MGRLRRRAAAALALGLAAAAGCDDAGRVERLTAELVPAVERAVGLRFRTPPVVEVRSREQVRAYVADKLAEQLPPEELAAITRAYRAFGLVPDTLDLARLMLDLYSEQVAGYYDPDSAVLYVVRGADRAMVRLVLAHELVHALQDQHTPLNDILKLRRQNDRQMAGQAAAEGQATLASMQALSPGADLVDWSAAWDEVRSGIRSQQSAMPVFAAAPRIIQEGLLFPYLAGAEFVRSFNSRRTSPDEQPWGERLPVTTEQVLHPARYAAGERALRLAAAAAPGDTLVYDDDFGEFETRVALESWGIAEERAVSAAGGWSGDRFAVLGTPSGTAVVWAVAWDSEADAGDFASAVGAGWVRRTGAPDGTYGEGEGARRWRIERGSAGGAPLVVLIDAPAGWPGWDRPAAVSVTR